MENKTPENKMFFLLALLAGFVGGAICMALNGYKNLGTAADWLSGIGSVGAILFAYLQIREQISEYENDKREYENNKKEEINQKILSNRPFFSIAKKTYLARGKDQLWTIIKDSGETKINDLFKKTTDTSREFKNNIYAYEFKNVSQALATNVVLKTEYQDKLTGNVLRTDYCNIGTCVMGNERAIILPHSIMNEPINYVRCPKNVYLYFTTIDDRAYCQRWIEKFNESNQLCIYPSDIEKVSKEEIPNKGVCNFANIS